MQHKEPYQTLSQRELRVAMEGRKSVQRCENPGSSPVFQLATFPQLCSISSPRGDSGKCFCTFVQVSCVTNQRLDALLC